MQRPLLVLRYTRYSGLVAFGGRLSLLEVLEVLEVVLLGVPVLVFEFVGVDFLAGADPGVERGRLGRFDLLEDVLGVDVMVIRVFHRARESARRHRLSMRSSFSLRYKPSKNL